MMIAFEINRCFVVARNDPEARQCFQSTFDEEIHDMKRIPFTTALFSAAEPMISCIADLISPKDDCEAALVAVCPQRAEYMSFS